MSFFQGNLGPFDLGHVTCYVTSCYSSGIWKRVGCARSVIKKDQLIARHLKSGDLKLDFMKYLH